MSAVFGWDRELLEGRTKHSRAWREQVHRGPDPEWYNFAQTVNRGPERNIEWSWAKTQLDKFNIHASETAWIGIQFDAVIDNNATMDHLYQQINDLVQDLQQSKDDPSV